MVESLISQDEGGEMFGQDRITRVGPRATFISKRTWGEVLEQRTDVLGRRMSFTVRCLDGGLLQIQRTTSVSAIFPKSGPVKGLKLDPKYNAI
jgi:hypothetical protein